MQSLREKRAYMAAYHRKHRVELRRKNRLRMRETRHSEKVKYSGHKVSILGVYCKVNLLASVGG